MIVNDTGIQLGVSIPERAPRIASISSPGSGTLESWVAWSSRLADRGIVPTNKRAGGEPRFHFITKSLPRPARRPG